MSSSFITSGAVLLLVCTTLLLQQPCSAAPKRAEVPAEWRDSEDHIPQVRHHHVKHEQTPETTEELAAILPESDVDKEKDSYALPPALKEDEKPQDQEQLPEEDLTSTRVEEKIPEEAAKPEELSNALPEKYEDTKPEEKSYPTEPKLKVEESVVLVKEFQEEESPKEPLVSLSLVKEIESVPTKQDEEIKPVEEIKSQEDESLSNEVFEKETDKKTEIKSDVFELKVLSPMLTLPKEDSKEQWSIIVKDRSPSKEEQIAEEIKEPEVDVPKKEEAKPEEATKQEESIVKEDVMPLLDEVYAALSSEETPAAPEPQSIMYDANQVKVNVVYDEPTDADKIFVKDLQEDIIKDVSNAIKDKVDQVQSDLLASKTKFEERFQAVREGIKVKQDYIKEAVQQKKDKINDFIDKFIFHINTTLGPTDVTPTTEATAPTSSPTEPNVTDPPPGPPEQDEEQKQPQQQPEQQPEELDGTGRQSGEEVTDAQEALIEAGEKQSSFLQQAQQIIQNVQSNFQGLQSQFSQNVGANNGAAAAANDGTNAEQGGSGTQPATGGQNIFQNIGQAFQTQFQNLQSQFRPPTDSSSTSSTNGELNDGGSQPGTPAEQNLFQQVGQAVQTGFQNVQTNLQGSIQNIQNNIQQQQQQSQIGAGSESGQVNPQNFLQQFGTAVQNGFQNVQNAFSPPAQSASVVSDPASEPQRPNIIQQGIQNFQASVIKPVQQLFQPTTAKPIIEEADVPVLQGSSSSYEAQDDYDTNDVEVNTVKKQQLKSAYSAVNKVEKVDKYVKSAPKKTITEAILVKDTSVEEKPEIEVVEDKKPEQEEEKAEESAAEKDEKLEAPLKNLVVVDETVEVVAPAKLEKTLLDESKTEEVSDIKPIQKEEPAKTQEDQTEEKPLKSLVVEKTEEVVEPVGTVEVTPV